MAPYSGDMLESVARSASESAERPSPQNSTKRPTTPWRRSSSVSVSTRSVAVTPSRSAPAMRTPTTEGVPSSSGSPSMTASASMPPTPKPSTPRPLIIVVCESVPTSVSGTATPSRIGHDPAEVLEVDLVHDPHAGRHDAERAERALRPAQQQVALDVALVLALDVVRVGLQRAGLVDLHGVVDHEVAGHERIDARRVAARARHRGAHRGEVDDGGHAREVLQQHARREERHALALARRRGPARQREHVLLAHVQPAGVAQQALEQDAHRVRQALRVGRTASRRAG